MDKLDLVMFDKPDQFYDLPDPARPTALVKG
jgi:hypothetical protein